jgi:hypothetical protein
MADDPARWLRRGVLGAIVVLGWVFIAWQNKFHVSASVGFVCLGYLAVVMTVYNLWRTGAAAVAPELGNDEAWARPLGARGELEKEKRSLLKAIKEAEFDHEMGKLSKADANAMIDTYRARAIAVIKELERFENNAHAVDPNGRILEKETARDQIAREVKARLELAGASKKKKIVDKAAAKAEKAAAKPADKTEANADKKAEKPAEKTEAKAEAAEAKAEAAEIGAGEEAAAAVEATTDSSSGATEATT